MKKIFMLSMLAAGMLLGTTGCKKEKADETGINGTWRYTDAVAGETYQLIINSNSSYKAGTVATGDLFSILSEGTFTKTTNTFTFSDPESFFCPDIKGVYSYSLVGNDNLNMSVISDSCYVDRTEWFANNWIRE